ncbi:MAG: hypothetical protein WCF76_19790, partial [Pseudolabrys sp.]
GLSQTDAPLWRSLRALGARELKVQFVIAGVIDLLWLTGLCRLICKTYVSTRQNFPLRSHQRAFFIASAFANAVRQLPVFILPRMMTSSFFRTGSYEVND